MSVTALAAAGGKNCKESSKGSAGFYNPEVVGERDGLPTSLRWPERSGGGENPATFLGTLLRAPSRSSRCRTAWSWPCSLDGFGGMSGETGESALCLLRALSWRPLSSAVSGNELVSGF